MSLPWVRLDSNIFTHDKVLWLLAQKDGWHAYGVYTFSLAYSGGHSTDGLIEAHVLPAIRANARTATLLVEAGLWLHAGGGSYMVKNWDQRQELALITETKRAASRLGGRKRACQRYHGPDCLCWKDESKPEATPKKGRSNA
jgi:hypothetical protein